MISRIGTLFYSAARILGTHFLPIYDIDLVCLLCMQCWLQRKCYTGYINMLILFYNYQGDYELVSMRMILW